jgi:transcriptional regulator with XRE-family HTH domain
MPKFTTVSDHDLDEFPRKQRKSAQSSLRQPSDVAGVSNPDISQIERGPKKPNAEILQALAQAALRISPEPLDVRGTLDERTGEGEARSVNVTDAILADPKLNDRQRAVLLHVYESLLGRRATGTATRSGSTSTTRQGKARRAPSAAPEPGTPTQPKITQKEKQS